MNPREFLQLASVLVVGTSASELRTAISRAYYATYNVSVEILTTMGFRIDEGPGGHGQVTRYLSNSGDPEVKKIGSQLGEFRSKRNRADYRMNAPDVENPKTAQAWVEQAKKMIKGLDECCSDPRYAQIMKALQEYRRKIEGPRG